MKKEICPVCGEGHLCSEIETVEFEYRSVKRLLNTKYSICDECGSEIASDSDAKFNKRTVIAFHKTVDGLLTGSEIKSIRDQLGITQANASKIFGGGPNSFTKYENDDVMQSVAMDKLIRLSIESEDAFMLLCKQARITHAATMSFVGTPILAGAENDCVKGSINSGWEAIESNKYYLTSECH
ncbi:type II toxin-antitoxin system MqsA family antitoxin [Morganella morganii]